MAERPQNAVRVAGTSGCRCRRGFSLVDLLVSLAVMTALVGIAWPTLSGVRESARRTQCASSVRQIGLALQMYTQEFGGLLPASVFRSGADGFPIDPSEMVRLRLTPSGSAYRQDTGGEAGIWDGIGLLASLDMLNQPQTFYCPSHRGPFPFDTYRDAWRRDVGEIVGNYHYRIPDDSDRLDRIAPNIALLADSMRSQEEYNHVLGNNVLRADMSVTWFADVAGELFASLSMHTDRDEGDIRDAWDRLDKPIRRDDGDRDTE